MRMGALRKGLSLCSLGVVAKFCVTLSPLLSFQKSPGFWNEGD